MYHSAGKKASPTVGTHPGRVAYTGVQAKFRLNRGKGVDSYAASIELGRFGHRLYLSDDHLRGCGGIFLCGGAPAPVPANHAWLRRRGDDGGQRLDTGEFEIHKMTFDEIVAAGIDINAAENRNVVKINVTLVYEREPIHSVIYWNGKTAKSDPIYVKTSSGTRKLTPCVIGSSNSSLTKAEDPTIVYLDVPVEFSYLKEFFSVSLHML